tara:strand:- start:197 stop:379 length:183 start_codon:yes stop_codon:yes gene_type:complete
MEAIMQLPEKTLNTTKLLNEFELLGRIAKHNQVQDLDIALATLAHIEERCDAIKSQRSSK